MSNSFAIDPKSPGVYIVRNEHDQVVHVEHLTESATALATLDAELLAAQYIWANAALLLLKTTEQVPPAPDPLSDNADLVQLRLEPLGQYPSPVLLRRTQTQKVTAGIITITYSQCIQDTPIWKAGVTLIISPHSKGGWRVVGASSSLHVQGGIGDADPWHGPYGLNTFADKEAWRILAERLGLHPDQLQQDELVINSRNVWYYRYNEAERTEDKRSEENALVPAANDENNESVFPVLRLPPMADLSPPAARPDVHYPVTEILFGWRRINWRAFVEAQTGAVLYLRAGYTACFDELFPPYPLAAGATAAQALLFPADPLTLLGYDPFTPAADPSDGTLAPLMTPVQLENVTSLNLLGGTRIQFHDWFSPPPPGPPPLQRQPWPASASADPRFQYSALRWDEVDYFTAVQAYHNCNAMYRMVARLGLDTDFGSGLGPVQVDPMGTGTEVNAFVCMDEEFMHADRIVFGRVQHNAVPPRADPLFVGNSTDLRMVLHEFCHVLLAASTGGFNLDFAHSAGDSLAAILNDPCSKVPESERYQTFPWIKSENPNVLADEDWRSHGRVCETQRQEWCWGGVNDDRRYKSEQLLSSTLFRIYAAIGGHPNNERAVRQVAARYMAYLIISAIAALPKAGTVQVPVDHFRTLLESIDQQVPELSKPVGSTIHKVIRWSFAQQGLYAYPEHTVGPGRQPVDVCIDHESYDPQQLDVWPPLVANPDAIQNQPGGTASDPQLQEVRVCVKNKGLQPAEHVRVRGYFRPASDHLQWGTASWTPMRDDAAVLLPPIDSNDEQLAGPLYWSPDGTADLWCLLIIVSADGDPSSLDINPTLAGPVTRLVAFDNNMAIHIVRTT